MPKIKFALVDDATEQQVLECINLRELSEKVTDLKDDLGRKFNVDNYSISEIEVRGSYEEEVDLCKLEYLLDLFPESSLIPLNLTISDLN